MQCDYIPTAQLYLVRRKAHLGGNSFPDSIDQELVLMCALRQLNYCNEVSLAKIIQLTINMFTLHHKLYIEQQ